MSYAKTTLGGVEIVLEAGAPEESIESIGGDSVLRLSQGAGVKMSHWLRRAGSISGRGWTPPGLDGLDYSQPLELRSRQVENVRGPGRQFSLPTTPRPDVPAWAAALVDGEWRRAVVSVAAGVATVVEVPGASMYEVNWMPMFMVFTRAPTKAQSADQTWSIAWEEA